MFLPLGRPRGSSGDLCGPFFADLWGPLWTSSLPQQADKRTHQGRGSADFLAILVPPWTGTPVHFARMSHAKPQLLSLAHINTSILERMSHAKTRFPHETRTHACLSEVSHKNTTFEPPGVLFCDCVVLWRRLWGPLWTSVRRTRRLRNSIDGWMDGRGQKIKVCNEGVQCLNKSHATYPIHV